MMGRMFDRLLSVMAAIAAGALAFMALSVDYEIVMRYFLGRPTSWVVDFTEYALLYCLFLASPWVLARNAHIRIDILLQYFSPATVRGLELVSSIIALAACAVFFIASAVVTWGVYQDGEILWRATILPKWPIFLAMPLGSLLLTIQFARRIHACLARPGQPAA